VDRRQGRRRQRGLGSVGDGGSVSGVPLEMASTLTSKSSTKAVWDELESP
jgi:hypothetical protein